MHLVLQRRDALLQPCCKARAPRGLLAIHAIKLLQVLCSISATRVFILSGVKLRLRWFTALNSLRVRGPNFGLPRSELSRPAASGHRRPSADPVSWEDGLARSTGLTVADWTTSRHSRPVRRSPESSQSTKTLQGIFAYMIAFFALRRTQHTLAKSSGVE
jgi:hypothetical protein